jgi:hypothetical protein
MFARDKTPLLPRERVCYVPLRNRILCIYFGSTGFCLEKKGAEDDFIDNEGANASAGVDLCHATI